MRLIIGLGNPGVGYTNTRHNVGCLLVDRLQRIGLPKNVVVQRSGVFMNESGVFVKKLVDQYKVDPSDLYIAHDDLDISLGSYKIQFGVGPKIHNGVNSVEIELGTKDFWRVRIGVDPTSRGASRGEEIVLEDFTPEEELILDKTINELCKKLATLWK